MTLLIALLLLSHMGQLNLLTGTAAFILWGFHLIAKAAAGSK